MDCKVVMPRSAPRSKVEACREYGAEVVLEEDVFRAFERALELAEDEGREFVHPFDDPDIVAGQGTVGLEILDELDDLDAVVVPVGGGGLAGGIAAAVGQRRAGVSVFGVEPEGADSMRRSLDAGEPVRLDRVDTIADGLASPMAGELTYPLIRRWAEDVVLVSDDEIARTMGQLLRYTKLLTEPAGAAAVAALLAGRIPVGEGATVAAVLSGGNVDLDRMKELV
jgi:threonine dehydratase